MTDKPEQKAALDEFPSSGSLLLLVVSPLFLQGFRKRIEDTRKGEH